MSALTNTSFNKFINSKLDEIQMEIGEFFQKNKSHPFDEIYIPLWKQIYQNKNIDGDKFFDNYRITFLPQKGFSIQEGVGFDPMQTFKTLEAVLELSKQILQVQETNSRYYILNCGIYASIFKPLIKSIKKTEYKNFTLILKPIASFKNILKNLRENTIISASPLPLKKSLSSICAPKQSQVNLCTLESNPPIPQESPISEATAKLWIENHSDEGKKTAKKFVKNISYISFEHFKNRLSASIASFKNAIDSQPYLIVLPEKCEQKSNFWVTSLAIKEMKDNPPQEILHLDQLANYLKENPSHRNLVFFDDGAYSGKQMSQLISNEYKFKDCFFFLIIPFMTIGAVGYMRSGNVWFSEYQRMYSIGDLFSGNDERLINSFSDGCRSSLTLTYFAHKVADSWSTHPILDSEGLLDNPINYKFRLIPAIKPPYKK